MDEEVTNGVPDHKETFDFGMEEPFEEDNKHAWTVMRGPNLFPEKSPELKPVVVDSMSCVNDIGKVIM